MKTKSNIAISKRQESFLKKYRKKRVLIISIQFLILFLFIAIWQTAASNQIINAFIFSSPERLLKCFQKLALDGTIFYHISITIGETIISFIIVFIISIILASLFWFCDTLNKIFEPALIMLNSLPKSALAPVLIVWMGNNIKTVILTGILLAVFASTISLTSGFYKVDPDKIKLMKTLGAGKWAIMTKLLLPASTNLILSTMKVNIGLCLVGVIIGEFLAAKSGLGYLIIYSSQVFEMDTVMLSIILLCIIAWIMYKTIALINKKLGF